MEQINIRWLGDEQKVRIGHSLNYKKFIKASQVMSNLTVILNNHDDVIRALQILKSIVNQNESSPMFDEAKKILDRINHLPLDIH